MSDLATYLGLYIKGDAAHKVDELEKGFERLSTRGAVHTSALSRSMGLAGQGIDKLTNRYTALLSGAAGAGALKYVGDLQERMNYMGITAGKSAQEMDALKKEVFAAAQMPDIRLDPAQLLDAIDTIVEKTGDLDFARANLVNMGRAMRATKADGVDMGAWVAQLSEKFGIKAPDDILAAIDHSINAGKAGAMTFKDLSSQGERLTAAYAAMGRTGRDAGKEQDALIQMIRKGTGSSEQAATAFEALMRTFGDAKKLEKLKTIGIKVMDDKGQMRSGVELYKELISKSKGDAVELGAIFDSEAMRALNAGIAEFKNTGGLKSLDDFMNVAADGTTVKADAVRANARNINASVTALTTAGKQFADVNLAGPVGDLADAIGKLQPEQVQATMKAIAWGAGALGAVIAVKKGVDAVRWTMDTVRYVRGGRSAGRGGGALADAAGAVGGGQPMPVIVMNWPGAGGGFAGGGFGSPANDTCGEAKPGKATPKSAIGRLAARGGRALDVGIRSMKFIGAASDAYDAYNAFTEGDTRGGLESAVAAGSKVMGRVGKFMGPLAKVGFGAFDAWQASKDGDTRRMAAALGNATGGALGGLAGGALGTLVAPGIGTAAGGFAGGTAGAAAGEAVITKLYDWLAGEQRAKAEPVKAEPAKVESTVALLLDLPLGVTAKATNLTSSAGLRVDLGQNF